MPDPRAETQPELIDDGPELRRRVVAARARGKRVALVPTMGALHAGHLSLVSQARSDCDLVVASVFVNPTQFAAGEDFDRYPRDLAGDRRLLHGVGCDLLFAPPASAMFPSGSNTYVEVGPDAKTLEGAHRPGHFRGVATVVLKLLNLAPADAAYLGQKDYQQTVVVRRMVADLNVPTEIVVCPTVREPDGLAMSSRNRYLSGVARQQALALSQGLRLAQEMYGRGERRAEAYRGAIARHVEASGAEVHYVAVLRPGTVQPVDPLDGPAVVAVAAVVGGTRLIDNAIIG